MKANERSVKYFDLVVRASTWTKSNGIIQLTPKPLVDLLSEIKKCIDLEKIMRSDRAATQFWHLDAVEVNVAAGVAVILVGRSDRAAADQAVSDPELGSFDVTEKERGQGNASSAHVVVKLKQDKPNMYRCLVEEATGISAVVISQLLRVALVNCSHSNKEFFEHPHPSNASAVPGGVKAKLHARYKFELTGHPSENFQAELDAGVLNGIEVLNVSENSSVWDEDKTTSIRSQMISLKLRKKDPSSFYEVITSVCKTAAKKNLPVVRIKFTDSAKFAHTVDIDPYGMAILNEERFVKRARMTDFPTKLSTACQQIHPDIRAKMIALLT